MTSHAMLVSAASSFAKSFGTLSRSLNVGTTTHNWRAARAGSVMAQRISGVPRNAKTPMGGTKTRKSGGKPRSSA
jgi:hypothetical protein